THKRSMAAGAIAAIPVNGRSLASWSTLQLAPLLIVLRVAPGGGVFIPRHPTHLTGEAAAETTAESAYLCSKFFHDATVDYLGAPCAAFKATLGQGGSRTANKRRKVHVGSVAAGPTIKLTDLPPTLVATIAELVGPAALALSRSCKVVRNMLDPREVLGKRTWRKVWEADGWPDPTAIAMSNYTFQPPCLAAAATFTADTVPNPM
ncbi:hypothetical protein HK405_006043, partial [Cladochytrium tenue]